MNLFDLTSEYQQLAELADNAVDADEQQAFTDTLEGLGGEIRQKVLGCAAVIRTMEATRAAIKAEQDRLDRKDRTLLNGIERLKAYTLSGMQGAKVAKVAGDLFTVSVRETTSVLVEWTDEEIAMPGHLYVRKKPAPPPEPDKVAIGKALKAGVEIPGCSLQTRESLQIR